MVLTKYYNFSTKVQHLFFAFSSQFKDYCATYYAFCYAVVKQHVITTSIIFRCHNNSFLINDAPLFKVIAFDITHLKCHYYCCTILCCIVLCQIFGNCTIWCFTIFMFRYVMLGFWYFDIALLINVALF